MNIRAHAAALALTALTASAALGACAGPDATPTAPVTASAAEQDAKPAGLPDGALKGQVESTTALTMLITNNTDEVWTLDAQTFTGVPNTQFGSVLGPHGTARAVVNSSNIDGVAIGAAYFNADSTANLQANAKVPLFGKDSLNGYVFSWAEQDRYLNVADPRFRVTSSGISGYTPTVTLTISYA